MRTQVVIDTIRLAYQYLGKAVADNAMPNCAIPVEQAFKRVGEVLEVLEHEQNLNPQQPIRPSVFEFAKEMESVLEKNDHKGGWNKDKCTESYLRTRLVEEVGEYFGLISQDEEFTLIPLLWRNHNIDGGNLQKHRDKIKKELVDIANFAMMLWSRS